MSGFNKTYVHRKISILIEYEIRAAALKSELDGPPQAPGPDSDFALISHARLLGYSILLF
jgi:hypothetical protein